MSPVVLSPEKQKDTSLIGEILEALSPDKNGGGLSISSTRNGITEPDTGEIETPPCGTPLEKKLSSSSSIPYMDDSLLTPGIVRTDTEFSYDNNKPSAVTLTDGS